MCGEPLYPSGIPVHPALQKLVCVGVRDIPAFFEETVIHFNEHFGLSERRHLQVRQNVAHMLGHVRSRGAG